MSLPVTSHQIGAPMVPDILLSLRAISPITSDTTTRLQASVCCSIFFVWHYSSRSSRYQVHHHRTGKISGKCPTVAATRFLRQVLRHPPVCPRDVPLCSSNFVWHVLYNCHNFLNINDCTKLVCLRVAYPRKTVAPTQSRAKRRGRSGCPPKSIRPVRPTDISTHPLPRHAPSRPALSGRAP